MKKRDLSKRHEPEPATASRPFASLPGSHGEKENVRDKWALSGKDAYVGAPKRRRLAQLVISLAVLLVLALMIFWLAPFFIQRYFIENKGMPETVFEKASYDSEDRCVVRVTATHLYHQPRVDSQRITQILFNEPLDLISEQGGRDFVHVRASDGLIGYVRKSDIVFHTESIEADLHLVKLVVSDLSRNIMSHPSNGTLLAEIMMNTVVYADEINEGVYRVVMPGGERGWMGSSGVVELSVHESVEAVGVRYFVSSALSFVNMTHLEHGLTKRGISVEGVVYISAGVNGVELPRNMEDQINEGGRVELQYDEITGRLLIDSIRPGDIVFLRDPREPTSRDPYEMAVCTESGLFLMTSQSRTILRIFRVSEDDEFAQRIIDVRRIFA